MRKIVWFKWCCARFYSQSRHISLETKPYQSTKVFGLLYCMLVGILLGCDYDGTECFPNLRINFKSISDVDSVQFYLNGEQVCLEDIEEVHDGIVEATKGLSIYAISCRTSEEESFDYLLSHDAIEKCIPSEEFPIWREFECEVSEKHKKDIDSSKLALYVYLNNDVEIVEPVISFYTGNHYNVIAERDTARWYSYTSSTRGRYFGFYGPPEKWERLGCAGGYCTASLPMVEKVACYDR